MLIKEIRRQTDVVGIFPNRMVAEPTTIARRRPRDQHPHWQKSLNVVKLR